MTVHKVENLEQLAGLLETAQTGAKIRLKFKSDALPRLRTFYDMMFDDFLYYDDSRTAFLLRDDINRGVWLPHEDRICIVYTGNSFPRRYKEAARVLSDVLEAIEFLPKK